MKLALFRAGGAAILLVAVAGCYRGSARTVSLAEIDRQPGWLMVRGVRVIRQESAHDCGSAALAMVLDHWGVSDAAAQIRRAMPSARGQGSTAGALRQLARDKGLQAFLITGGKADLVRELRANRPVLVGLVQRYTGEKALSHYEVLIGINEASGHVLLLDPGRGPREDGLAAFDREWRDAGRLTLVVAPAGARGAFAAPSTSTTPTSSARPPDEGYGADALSMHLRSFPAT